MSKTTLNSIIGSLLSFTKEAGSFFQKQATVYHAVVAFMIEEGMTLKDFNARVAEFSKTWQKNDADEKVGRQKAAEAGCPEAIAMQAFAVWYGKNIDKDKDGVIIVDKDNKPVPPPKKERTPAGSTGEKKTAHDKDSENSPVATLEGDDLIFLGLKQAQAKIEKYRGTISKRAQLAEAEEFSTMINELLDFLKAI